VLRLPLLSARARWALAALVAALVLAATLWPSAGTADLCPVVEWLLHALGFGALALALAAALDGPTRRPRAVLGWAFLGAVAFGGLVELLQPLAERRTELVDLLADAGGAAVALACYRLGHRVVR
jgi:VanZ family protein